METGVKERLISFLEYKKISKSEFGRILHVSNAYVTSLRKSISPEILKGIALNFPDLNTTWLLTGEGEMLKGESPKMPDNQEKNAKNNINISINVLKTMEEQAASLLAQSETMRSLSESIKTRDRQIDRMLSMLEEWQQRAFSGDSTRSIDIRADLDAQNPPPVKIRQK